MSTPKMRLRTKTLSFLALFALALACNTGGKADYTPSSTGAINALTVVMNNELWTGEVGDKVREHFAAPVVGLIWDEPLFDISQLPIKSFTGSIRRTRSILYVQQDSLDVAHVKDDMYATPQKVGVIKGRTSEELIANIESSAESFISEFKKVEIEEAQSRIELSMSKEGVLREKFGISLKTPSLYTVGKQEDNFVWIDHQIPKGTMNIVAYQIPSGDLPADSTLVRNIIRMRDSIGEKYIPGPDIPNKTTHMRTEPAFAPAVFTTTVAGKDALEVRGFWDIKNYPMAGPFLTYIINDPENDRKLVLEGFTFAPSTEKRDYMFELEAILRTVAFNKPK